MQLNLFLGLSKMLKLFKIEEISLFLIEILNFYNDNTNFIKIDFIKQLGKYCSKHE